MKRASFLTFTLLAATATGLALTPLAAQDAGDVEAEIEADAEPMTKGEMRLAKLLDGRVAGEPVSCIRTLPNQRMETIDGTAYVYGRGNTIYVQRTRHPDQINDNEALVINRFNATQLCRMDVITTIDQVNRFFTGAVFFDDFVPYTRIKTDTPAEG